MPFPVIGWGEGEFAEDGPLNAGCFTMQPPIVSGRGLHHEMWITMPNNYWFLVWGFVAAAVIILAIWLYFFAFRGMWQLSRGLDETAKKRAAAHEQHRKDHPTDPPAR